MVSLFPPYQLFATCHSCHSIQPSLRSYLPSSCLRHLCKTLRLTPQTRSPPVVLVGFWSDFAGYVCTILAAPVHVLGQRRVTETENPITLLPSQRRDTERAQCRCKSGYVLKTTDPQILCARTSIDLVRIVFVFANRQDPCRLTHLWRNPRRWHSMHCCMGLQITPRRIVFCKYLRVTSVARSFIGRLYSRS